MNDQQNGPQAAEEAKRYAREKVRLKLAGMAIDLAFLAVMAFAGAAWLDSFIEPITGGNRWLHLIAFSTAFGAVAIAVGLPLSFYGGFIHEHKYKLSNQTLGAWLFRQLKMLLLTAIFGLLMVAGLYALLWYMPDWWWLAAAGALLLFNVVLGQLFPVLFVPLFYKVEKIASDDLIQRFRKLAAGTGITIDSVFKLGLSKDTKKANAMLAGLGNTKRVMLGDTLLNEFTPEEIEVVFAHELGHSVHNHLWKGIVGSTIATLAGLFLCHLVIGYLLPIGGHAGPGAVSALPLYLLVLTVFSTVIGPLEMAVTRHFERQSDWFALEKTADTASYKSAFTRLGTLNKADPNPPRWAVILFHSHPPIGERIAMADAWKLKRGKENVAS